MTFLALCAIVMVPLGLLILEQVFDRPLSIQTGTIARIVLTTGLLPVTAGIDPGPPARFRETDSETASPSGDRNTCVGGACRRGGSTARCARRIRPGQGPCRGDSAIAGLAIGHIMGGPNPHEAAVVALSTACRHPGIALTLAAANNPGEQFGPIVLFYLVIGAVVGIPYLLWSRRSTAALAAHRTRSA